MSDPGSKSPSERALDIAVYAPLGLALTVAESFPQLATKGRARLGAQIGLARTVGQFAVRQGIRQVRGFANQRPPFPFWPTSGQDGRAKTSTYSGTTRSADGPSAATENGTRRSNHRPAAGTTSGAPSTAAGRAASAAARHQAAARDNSVAAAHLAIPSYDSLSASQVVQRLAGLSREEVEAVRAYESATRGRRTILAPAEQHLA
jgi:hypothetical protein